MKTQPPVTLAMVKMMWAAMLVGALVIPAAMGALSWQGILPPAMPELGQPILIGVVVLAVIARVAASWVYERILLGSEGEPLRVLQIATIVGMAVCEGACMVVGVSVLLTGKLIALVALLSPLSGMLRMQPGQGSLDALQQARSEAHQSQQFPR